MERHIQIRGVAFSIYSLKVTKGDKVLFWHDPWCSIEPLCHLFSSCYNLSACKWGSVIEHMIRTRIFYSWNLHPRRNLNDCELDDVGMLLELSEGYHFGS